MVPRISSHERGILWDHGPTHSSEVLELHLECVLLVRGLGFSDVSWKHLAKWPKFHFLRVSGRVDAVAPCTVMFSPLPAPKGALIRIYKERLWMLSLGASFQVEYYFSGKLHNKWNWQFQDEMENRWRRRLNEEFPSEEGDGWDVCFELDFRGVLVIFLLPSSSGGWKVDSIFCLFVSCGLLYNISS